MTETKSRAGEAAKRPLSPHLSIYRPPINMVMSILHRLSGAALYLGTLLFVWFLVATAAGPEPFATAGDVFGSWIGLIILFGYTWALALHMLGGIRHLTWDTGHGFDLETVDRLSWGTLAGSLVITWLIWWAALPFPVG